MADRALTEDAVLAGLQDIRLPHVAPGGLIAELMAAIGLGLCLAFLVATLLRHTAMSRGDGWRVGRASEQAQTGTISDTDRQLALMETLKKKRPDAYAKICTGIYQRGGLPEMAILEAEVRHND